MPLKNTLTLPALRAGPRPLPASAGLSGENILAMPTCVILPENELKSSCADLIRVSTSLSLPSQGVDAHGSSPWAEGPRDKPGQDEIGRRFLSVWRREMFPGKPCAQAGIQGRVSALIFSWASR